MSVVNEADELEFGDDAEENIVKGKSKDEINNLVRQSLSNFNPRSTNNRIGSRFGKSCLSKEQLLK